MMTDSFLPLLWNHIELLCALVVPVAAFVVCLLVGALFRRWRWGAAIGLGMAAAVETCWFYGSRWGFERLEVRHVDFASPDLPPAFDGYRIVLFSDVHCGTYTGRRAHLLRRVVDSINAQQPDAVIFAGDLQNRSYTEVLPHQEVLSAIEARDGVFSVLGNHDYAQYMSHDDPFAVSEQIGRSRGVHRDMGWRLLCNDRVRLRRDSARIVIAGMENDGEGRFPQLGNISAALYGVSRSEFVVMVEHDPTSWRRRILPHCHAQLTLSGHTHGGQLSLLGWSPARLRYREYDGIYHAGHRALVVTRGVGGVVPFRLGASGEIVVVTLRSTSHLVPRTSSKAILAPRTSHLAPRKTPSSHLAPRTSRLEKP